MAALARDPLLAIAKGLLWFLMACMLVGAAACVVAVPAMHIFQDQVTIELAKEAPKLAGSWFIWAITGVLACAVVLLLILFRTFQLLKRIVDTVGEGDPFVPINATRLVQMAWLSLGVQLVSIVVGSLGAWIAATSGETRHIHGDIEIDGGLSGNGLLLMLILFILARVFRKGADMRAELEGTV